MQPCIGKAGTLLVAEDEPLIRLLMQTVFETNNFRVLSAANGVEAMELARQYEGQIDMLLTDVAMPNMGGRELARELRKMYPQSYVLYLSGHSSAELEEFCNLAVEDFMCKPFQMKDLLSRVRARMSAKEPETL